MSILNAINGEDQADVIKSSARTMALFEFYSDIKRGATITEISSALCIPQSSASSLVKSLIVTGYLQYTHHQRHYTPTLRLRAISNWVLPDSSSETELLRTLNHIQSETGETACLVQRNSIYSQYIYVAPRSDSREILIRTGSRRPLACTASGWAILSTETDNNIGKIVRRTQAEVNRPVWRKIADQAISKIEETKTKGYSTFGSEFKNTQLFGVSASLPADIGPSQYAITVASKSSDLLQREEHIAGILNQSISKITNFEMTT